MFLRDENLKARTPCFTEKGRGEELNGLWHGVFSLLIRLCVCYLPQRLKLAMAISSEEGIMICVAVESLRVEE